MPTVAEHERLLRAMPCVVSGRTPVTLHHAHGGSMCYLQDFPNPGMGQRQNRWLQIPLHADYHTGNWGIDAGYGVMCWELDFGTQVEHLSAINARLPYDLWEQARLWAGESKILPRT